MVIFLGVEKLCNHVDDCDGMLSETTVLTSRTKSRKSSKSEGCGA